MHGAFINCRRGSRQVVKSQGKEHRVVGTNSYRPPRLSNKDVVASHGGKIPCVIESYMEYAIAGQTEYQGR